MRTRIPQIVALGGGGFSMEKDSTLLDDYILALTRARRPRVCFLPTASGDADHYVVRFYRRFSALCEASHISMFRRDQGGRGVEDDLASHLLGQDSDLRRRRQRREHARRMARTRPGRGSARGMAARDRAVRPSAGSLCWFAEMLSRLPWPAATRRRPGAAALLQLRPLRRRAGAPRRVPRASWARVCAPGTPPTTGWHFTSRGQSWIVWSARASAAAPSTCDAAAAG